MYKKFINKDMTITLSTFQREEAVYSYNLLRNVQKQLVSYIL